MLGKPGGRGRRGRQRVRWLDGIPTQWMWVWAGSGRWRWTGRPGVLRPVGSQSRAGQSGTATSGWPHSRQLSEVTLRVPQRCGENLHGLCVHHTVFHSQDFQTLVCPKHRAELLPPEGIPVTAFWSVWEKKTKQNKKTENMAHRW